MNWEINKITLRGKNFKSTPLKIKSIKKMETQEWENEKAPRDWGKDLQAYWAELEGKVTFPNSDLNHENKIRVLGRSYKEISSNQGFDIFYYFVSNLGKEIEIPFRSIVYNNARDTESRKVFFLLSDSEVNNGVSENKEEINKIIEDEKAKWDKFGYKDRDDLIQENKLWVDKGIYREYKNAFLSTNLIDKSEEIKKWQDSESKTGLNAFQAANAYKNGWISDEVNEKLGKLNDDYSYDVLTLQKNELQKFEKQLTEKIQEVDSVSSQNKKQLLSKLEAILTDWNSSIATAEQKAVLGVNKQQLEAAIKKLQGQPQITEKIDDFQAEIQRLKDLSINNWKIIGDLQKENKGLRDEVDKLNQEITNLKGQQNLKSLDEIKAQAKIDIQVALDNGYVLSEANGDIIPTYQGYIGTIDNFTNQKEVEDFAKEMIDYLGRQRKSHQALKDALDNGENASKDDNSVDNLITNFEGSRQARQELDKLVENREISSETKQAYQVINKDNKVADCIGKLANQLWNHLVKKSEERENDPSNWEFLQAIDLKGYKKGSEEFKRYWLIWAMAEEFSKVYLDNKEISVYPETEDDNAFFGSTNWNQDESGFDLHFNLGVVESLFWYTCAHELSHDWAFLKEAKGLLSKSEYHIKAFWDKFLIGNKSTLAYLDSCLLPQKQQDLKNFVNPSIINEESQNARVIYSPNIFPSKDWEKLEKTLEEEDNVNKEWINARQTVSNLVEDSMNENIDNWRDYSELEIRSFEVAILQGLQKGDTIGACESENGKNTIKIFFDGNKMPAKLQKSIRSNFDSGHGWKKMHISNEEITHLCQNIRDCGCGKENNQQQQAQIVANPLPSLPNK